MTKKKGVIEAPETPKSKAPLEKVNVVAKQIGKNLNVTVGEEKFTRVGDKETLEQVKASIKVYVEKPTKNNFSIMMKLLKPETTKKEVEEVKVKADIKATKKKVEEKEKETKSKKTIVADVVKEIDEKLMSESELSAMQAALDRQKAKRATAPQPTTTATPRRGERY